MKPVQSKGFGSVKGMKEYEKDFKECIDGGNPDDSASQSLSLKISLEVMAASITSSQSAALAAVSGSY